MSSHASRIAAVEDEPFVEQLRHLALHTTDLTGVDCSHAEHYPTDAQLTELRRQVTDLVNGADTPSHRKAEGYGLLIALHDQERAGLDTALDRHVSALSEIREGIVDLSGLSPYELFDTVPIRASRCLSVGRAMISTISGSTWLPQHLYIKERTPGSAAFEEFVDGAQIPLSRAPLETELLVRRRTVALVPDPVEDKRTYKAIVHVAQTLAYLAAPITVRGRTVGMLHADRPEDPASLTDDDLQLFAAFAECVSIAFESAYLQQRMKRQIELASTTFSDVASMVDDSGRTPAWTRPVREQRANQHFGVDHGRTAALTAREREVLDHLSTGATNLQIAHSLVVSEATIKSHLKQISRKLDTPSRAAAVAAYARMTDRPKGIGPWAST